MTHIIRQTIFIGLFFAAFAASVHAGSEEEETGSKTTSSLQRFTASHYLTDEDNVRKKAEHVLAQEITSSAEVWIELLQLKEKNPTKSWSVIVDEHTQILALAAQDEEKGTRITVRDILEDKKTYSSDIARKYWRGLLLTLMQSDKLAEGMIFHGFMNLEDNSDFTDLYLSKTYGIMKVMYVEDGLIDRLIRCYLMERPETCFMWRIHSSGFKLAWF